MSPRSPITRPETQRDVVLQLALTVTPEGVTLDYKDLTSLNVARVELAGIFAQSGQELRDGIFQIRITADGVRVTDDAEVYSPEIWQEIVGPQTVLGKIFKAHFGQLVAAYRGMVVDNETLEEIVRAAVERAIHVYVTDDPLKMHLVFPELKELEAMQFEGGCSACAFTGLATSISGLIDGRKPEVRADVATVGGRVNVRAFLPDGVLAIVVGYLGHENVFEKVFHEDLVARLQPLLTPELIREVIQNHLVMGEVARRAHTRAHSTMWEAYGLDIYDIATLADAKEAEIEEDMRRERERPPMRSRFEAFLRESLMMDDTDPG